MTNLSLATPGLWLKPYSAEAAAMPTDPTMVEARRMVMVLTPRLRRIVSMAPLTKVSGMLVLLTMAR